MNNKTNKKTINIISNRNINSLKISEQIKSKFQKHNFKVLKNSKYKSNLNIAIGGDGTFLKAVHKSNFCKTPIIGINTGHLGFFQEIDVNEVDWFIKNYMLNNYSIQKMFIMSTNIKFPNRVLNIKSVNEIYIKTKYSQVIHLDLYINNNHLQRFSGDGIIISTPAGSTAYNYSVNGAIVHPKLKALQITPVAPIMNKAFRSLPNSIIFPGNYTIRVVPDKRYRDSLIIVNDGFEKSYNNIEYIEIKISNNYINRLSFKNKTYWDNLKEKFL